MLIVVCLIRKCIMIIHENAHYVALCLLVACLIRVSNVIIRENDHYVHVHDVASCVLRTLLLFPRHTPIYKIKFFFCV